MAKIPLRTYLKEIDNLIQRGEIEQAIAHAKNILRSYPKNIETYRLLGKAYLESQRYSEAADILQRVLSVVPDDFVSQIGMSIIREDEGNLDASIWHMERAYEVQPFNPAVQDELRRLYGKRDGVEPPKIRLTRGALVRMYARGELYQQAIAETRAALAEDPQRVDLRVLLARLYFQNGQKNDAAEVCSELLSKLPFCYEANRLLAEILPGTSRAGEAAKFQQRIIALDPYEAFLSSSSATSQQVPEQAVMVEQYAWEAGAAGEATPDWTRTVGVDWETSEEEVLPDWLNTLTPGAPAAAADALEAETPAVEGAPQDILAGDESITGEDLVPDWMKEAGWSATERTADQIMAEQMESEAEALPSDEMPDWLQSIAPPAAVEDDQERTDWLETIITPPAGESPLESAPVDMQDTAGEAELAGDLPDWMAELASGEAGQPAEDELPAADVLPAAVELPAAEEAELPGWLSDMDAETTNEFTADTEAVDSAAGISTPSIGEETLDGELAPALDAEAQESEELPDWLRPVEAEAALEEETSGWDQTLPGGEIPAAGEQMAGELPAEEAETVPGFAAALDPESTDSAQRTTLGDLGLPPMPDMNDTEATMAWLEMLASRQGADEATLITPPEQRTETPPEWVEQFESEAVAEEITAAADNAPSDEASSQAGEDAPLPDWLAESEPLVSALDEADAVQPEASFAVNEEELPPSEAAEAEASTGLPDLADEDAAMAWFESLAARQGADEATLVTAPEDRPEAPPEWIEQMRGEEPTQPIKVGGAGDSAQVETPAEAETEEALAAELPDWLAEESAESAGSPAAQAETPAPDLTDMDAAMAWLESLAARQGADEETLTTAPEDRPETPPDWVQQLEQTQDGAPATAEPDLPDWLADTDSGEELAGGVIFAAEEGGEGWMQAEPPPAEQIEGVEAAWLPANGDARAEDALKEATGEALAGQQDAEVPAWLQDLERDPVEPQAAEELPEWLRGLPDAETAEAQASEETAAAWQAQSEEGPAAEEAALPEWLADDQPAESAPVAQDLSPMPDWLASLEEETGLSEEPETVQAQEYTAAWVPEDAASPLAALKAELERGSLQPALEGYNRMIEQEEQLEEVIQHLSDALYRYPIDISLWQTLGDAYARNNQLQEALDAYTKAEELLR